MNRQTLTLPLMASLSLLLVSGSGCSRKASHPKEDERHEHAAGEGEPARVPIQAMRGIRLMEVPSPRAESRWIPGEARGDEASQAILSSPVKGIVGQLLATPGQRRGAGAPLALIQSPELARLKAEWIAAKAKLGRAQAELAREERLYQAGAGARRDLEAIRSEAETAQAEEEAARLGLEAVGLKPGEAGARFQVKAPCAGSLVAWKVQRGQGVEAGQELGAFQATLAAIVSVELPLPGPTQWTAGATTEVRSSSGQVWRARVEGLPTALTNDTKRLSFRLRLAEGPLPIPGTAVEVKVPMDRGVYVPQSALQQVDGRWGVFVVEQQQAGFRAVTRGADIKDEVLVIEGLKPGETVVAEGAYLLKATLLKRSEPEGEEGHGH